MALALEIPLEPWLIFTHHCFSLWVRKKQVTVLIIPYYYLTDILFRCSCLYLQLLYQHADNISNENVPQIFKKKKSKKYTWKLVLWIWC